MRTLLHTNKWRLAIAAFLTTFIPLSSLVFTSASAFTKKTEFGATRSAAAAVARTPIYNAGNFTFGATKQLLPNTPLPLGFQDVEPEIKVDLFGNIYISAIEGVPAGVDLWKSTDQGASFAYLGQPDGAQCPAGSTCTNDAGLGGGDDSIDVSSGGYLYVSSLWLGSVTMSASYDGGVGGVDANQKWEVNPVAASVPSDDRQWVAAYGPNTVYMSYRQILAAGANATNVIFVAKSTDGGKTFPQQVATFPATSLITARREGNLVVDPYNGNLYTSFRPQELNGHTRAELWLLKSTDGGMNWAMSQIYQGPTGSDIGNVFPVMAVDRGGNVHVAFSQCDYDSVSGNSSNCSVYLTSSADQGNSWLAPVKVNNGPATSYAILPWIVAGSPGVVDVTWYGANITNSTQAADWHLYFAQGSNVMSANPSFSQVQAISQVVHNKDICLKGGACGSTGNRSLAEYYQIALDPQGNANIAFTDTVNSNTTGAGRTWFTKQTAGPSAYQPPAGPAPATFSPNISLGSPGGEPGLKVDSHNCVFATAPGEPWVRKSVDNGATFLPKVNPVADRPLNAGDEDILPIPLPNGARPDPLYFVDLAQLTSINVAKSTDGGATWAPPGPGGAAGNVDASTDRQWIAYDRNVPANGDLTIYEMDHEAATEEIRFNALTNDMAWSPPASGITSQELILPPNSTFPNTNPGPVLVDPATHLVYGYFNGSTINTNRANPPFGKMPNVWQAKGAPPAAAGAPPGPFANLPVFKGVFDSPTTPAPPAGSQTFGTNCSNDFPTATIDKAGNIYVAWAMNNSRNNEYMVWFAASHDHGNTFYGPFQVSQGPGAALMPWVAAGDDGRLEIVYYATTTPGDPNFASPATTHWNTMFAQSFNAASREPVFTISQVSDHIMHNGGICNQGLLCQITTGGDRSLADFFQVAIGPDGLANIVFADNGSSATHATYARQTSGPLGLINPTFPTCLGNVVPVMKVASEKTHGATTFPIDLPLTGTRGVECRGNGPVNDYKVVFTFANPLTSVGSASVTNHDPSSGTGSVSSSMIDPNDPKRYIVNLTGVSTGQYIRITLNSVTDSTGNVANVVGPQMGVLVGDVNATGRVDGNDVSETQSHTRQNPDESNFRYDVNADGRIDGNDVSTTQSRTRSGLPSSP